MVAMILVSSPFCAMCGTTVAEGIKRQRPQQHHHLKAVHGAFLSSAIHKFTDPTPPPPPHRHQQKTLLDKHCCDFTNASLKMWQNLATGAAEGATGTTQMRMRRNAELNAAVRAAVEQPHLQARNLSTRKSLFSCGSLSSALRPLPSPKETPTAPPRNVAVLARGDNDLERCRRLAQKLGVELVVPRREDDAEQRKEQEGRGGRAVGSAAEGGHREIKFRMLFDKEGRLALDQPGSGFNPLVVRRPNEVYIYYFEVRTTKNKPQPPL